MRATQPHPVGCDRKTETIDMTTIAQSVAARVQAVAIIAAAILGLGVVTVAGHVQAETLHAAAHDVRHATGFPCH